MARIYDLVMTHKLDTDDFFIHRIQQHCAERGLNFFLIEPLWVEPFRLMYEFGELWARVLLNMHSEHHEPDESYHRLIRLAAGRQTRIIDPPDVALAAFDKAQVHPRLIHAGIHVPHTLFVRAADVAEWKLTDEHRVFLGSPFVIKPSLGYGRQGVILDALTEADLLRSAKVWRDPVYLLQRRITPRELDGRPAYFRVFHAFGSVWFTWWNCYTDEYRLLTPLEMERFALDPLREIVLRIAAVTGMNFFSSEIAQTADGQFVVIDYVNDQCHLLTQSASPQKGVPDEVVAGIAHRLVEAAHRMIRHG